MKNCPILKFTAASILLFTIIHFSLFTFHITAVHAQSVLPLSIANARNELTLDPGETRRVTLKIYNNAQVTISGSLKIVDFVVNDNEGTPIFIDNNQNQIDKKYSAAAWMSLPFERLTIAPTDKTSFDVTINVPFEAKPGGRYAAVIFEASPSNFTAKDTQIRESESAISPSLASLFYLVLPGPTLENAIISRLETTGMAEYGPVSVTSEIANRSDIHLRPKGFLTVSDWMGRLSYQEKLEEANIYPDAKRVYENTIGEKWMFGRYKLNLSVSYGSGKVVNASGYFWVIPWKVITMIALTLAIIVLLVKNFRHKADLGNIKLRKKLEEEEKELEKLKEELKKQ